jgi:nitrate/nitrite transporter NarK
VYVYWRSGDPGPRPHPGGAHVRIGELPGLFRHRVMWLSGIIQFVRLAVVSGLAFWLPSYLVEDKGFSLRVAGSVAAVGAAMTAPSNFLGGYVSDRLQRPELIIGTSLTVLASTLVLLVNVHSFWLVVGVVAVNSIFVQLYFGPLFAVPIKVLGQRLAGLTSGASNFCANMGGLTFSYTLGAVKDATGSFSTGLYALAGLCVVGIVATVMLARVEPEAPDAFVVAPAPVR